MEEHPAAVRVGPGRAHGEPPRSPALSPGRGGQEGRACGMRGSQLRARAQVRCCSESSQGSQRWSDRNMNQDGSGAPSTSRGSKPVAGWAGEPSVGLSILTVLCCTPGSAPQGHRGRLARMMGENRIRFGLPQTALDWNPSGNDAAPV